MYGVSAPERLRLSLSNTCAVVTHKRMTLAGQMPEIFGDRLMRNDLIVSKNHPSRDLIEAARADASYE